MNDIVLSIHDLKKSFDTSHGNITILENITFDIAKSEVVAIVGPSGSGKTTLLGLSAGLDKPSSGKVTLMGHLLNDKSEDEKAKVRNEEIGFVFQNFQLIPSLTALENIMVPLELRGDSRAKAEALKQIEAVGLLDRQDHYPSQLSGGEQQRIAIARAFVTNPAVLFADEPTGNLDDDTGGSIEDLLFQMNKDHGTTLIIVTHDMELAKKTNRIIRLKSGKIASDQLTKDLAEA
jgi:putative ABC transport system ATP-binding protein